MPHVSWNVIERTVTELEETNENEGSFSQLKLRNNAKLCVLCIMYADDSIQRRDSHPIHRDYDSCIDRKLALGQPERAPNKYDTYPYL